MSPLGISKTVLLGEITRATRVHHGRDGRVRALLSLTTRLLPVGIHGDSSGSLLTDAHLVYCEGSLAKQVAHLGCGALVYVEGKNREQRWSDAGGKNHHLSFVSASVIRLLSNTAAAEGVNTVTLIGTVTSEPSVRYTAEQQCESVGLRIMTTHGAPAESADSPKYHSEYHDVTFVGLLARRVFSEAHEASLVFVEGRNQLSHCQDGEQAHHRSITIVGQEFQLLHTHPVHARPPERNLEVMYGYDVQLPEEALVG